MAIGFICVALSATLLGILPTIQKQLMMNGLPLYGLMFYTNLTSCLFCFIMSLVKKRSFRASAIQIAQSMLMGSFGMLFTAVLLNTSYMYLPVGTAIMLSFLYPTLVCVIMGTIFKAGFSKMQILAIVSSILGMAFLTGGGGELSVKGMVLAIASAFTYAIYMVSNEKGPANELPIEVKMFYATIPAAVTFAVLAPATGSLVAPPGGLMGWVLAIGGSGMFTMGGFFLMIYGISRMGASTASFVSMLEPVISVVFGTIWFHDPITVGVVAGGALILLGILFITIDGAKKGKK